MQNTYFTLILFNFSRNISGSTSILHKDVQNCVTECITVCFTVNAFEQGDYRSAAESVVFRVFLVSFQSERKISFTEDQFPAVRFSKKILDGQVAEILLP